MTTPKQPLKNDQSNHLSEQLDHFEKIEPHVQRENSDKKVPYETPLQDIVTPNFVRGYN